MLLLSRFFLFRAIVAPSRNQFELVVCNESLVSARNDVRSPCVYRRSASRDADCSFCSGRGGLFREVLPENARMAPAASEIRPYSVRLGGEALHLQGDEDLGNQYDDPWRRNLRVARRAPWMAVLDGSWLLLRCRYGRSPVERVSLGTWSHEAPHGGEVAETVLF